jgi:hypothetical protein
MRHADGPLFFRTGSKAEQHHRDMRSAGALSELMRARSALGNDKKSGRIICQMNTEPDFSPLFCAETTV